MREIRKEIAQKLAEIEERENVKILYAAESGSRAWGVESPDSDYDVRFVYVREKEDYLRLVPVRDTLEWQLDEVLDINGWDLKKALVQFHKGNATLFEWANSPAVYKTTEMWTAVYGRCRPYFSEKASLYHYYGTADSTCRQYLQEERVRYKKYIYALRPLLACRYIEHRHAVPPVRFEELLEQGPESGLTGEIRDMLAVKAVSDEGVLHPQIPAIRKFIEEEILRYGEMLKTMPDDRRPEWEPLDRVFLETLESGGDAF